MRTFKNEANLRAGADTLVPDKGHWANIYLLATLLHTSNLSFFLAFENIGCYSLLGLKLVSFKI